MNEQMAIGDMPDEQARLVFLRVFYKALGEVPGSGLPVAVRVIHGDRVRQPAAAW